MTTSEITQEAISRAIFDPGATEGYKGERTLTEWQTDAVMRALSTLPIAGEVKDTAIADELTAALEGAFVTTTSGGGQRPYLTAMFPENSQVRRLHDALASFSSLRRNTASPDTDGGQEVEVEAVAWQYFNDGAWRHSTNPDYHRQTGYEMRPLYASPPSPQSTVDAEVDDEFLAKSLAKMVTEWVDGGIEGDTDWRNGLSSVILSRIRRFKVKSPSSGHAASEGERAVYKCPICAEAINDNDLCATDITEGTCHVACLDGSPVVDLETGEPTDSAITTFRYAEKGDGHRQDWIGDVPFAGNQFDQFGGAE